MNAEERLRRAEVMGLKYQLEFEQTLSRLAELRLNKCLEYGELRYEETDPEVNRWMAYSDVLRKFIRLRQQMMNKDRAGLLETYQDLAAYSAMALQILSRPENDNEV